MDREDKKKSGRREIFLFPGLYKEIIESEYSTGIKWNTFSNVQFVRHIPIYYPCQLNVIELASSLWRWGLEGWENEVC